MEHGKLNRRVTIERQTKTRDAAGQQLSTWIEVARPWASIIHKSGLATIKGNAPLSEVQASIRIRYRKGIAAGMRVVHGDVVYTVQAVLPDEAKREHVDLVCLMEAVR